MGGDAEPFEVERLAGFLHRQSIALVKVGWYSGKNELPEGLSVQNFEYIKLGPYIEKLGGLKSPDTNQHFYRIYGDEMKDITYRFGVSEGGNKFRLFQINILSWLCFRLIVFTILPCTVIIPVFI